MSQEQFANNAATTLNGAIGSSNTSITVASATGFPTTPQFRILIDQELMLVTAVTGTTWTVSRGIEGTTAAAHSNGAAVVQELTAGGLVRLYGGVNAQTGTSYTLAAADKARLVTLNNASAIALTLPTPSTSLASPQVDNEFYTLVSCIGAGTVTYTPQTGTVDGAASGTLTTGQSAVLFTDGTNWFTFKGAATRGTVTSVGLSLPAEFSVSGSPVTGSGTLAVTKANENANTVWAGPSSGGPAAPTFRSLGAADVPAVNLSALPSGAANLVVATPNGSPGTPTERALVAADLPQIAGTILGSSFVATAQSTTSTTLTDLATVDSVAFSLQAAANVVIAYHANVINSGGVASQSAYDQILVDGGAVGSPTPVTMDAYWGAVTYCGYKVNLAAGSHTVKVQHYVQGSQKTWSERLITVTMVP